MNFFLSFPASGRAIPLNVRKGGAKAVGIVLALGLVVGVVVCAGIYVVRKN